MMVKVIPALADNSSVYAVFCRDDIMVTSTPFHALTIRNKNTHLVWGGGGGGIQLGQSALKEAKRLIISVWGI